MRHYDYTPRLLWCLLTLLLLLPVGQAHGQTSERHVTARIVNAETGAPIVDVLCSAWDASGTAQLSRRVMLRARLAFASRPKTSSSPSSS